MKNKTDTKKGRILKHLKTGSYITPQIALRKYGHFRLAVVINRLRNEGYPITTEIVHLANGDSFAKYRMGKSFFK